MAMMSLRGAASVIGRRELYTAKGRRAYHRGREGRGIEFLKLSPCSAVCSVYSVVMVVLLADVLWPGPRDEGLLRWRDLQQRALPHMHEAQLASGQKCVDRLLHAGPRYEIRKESFDLSLVGGDHTTQVFGDHGRERFHH